MYVIAPFILLEYKILFEFRNQKKSEYAIVTMTKFVEILDIFLNVQNSVNCEAAAALVTQREIRSCEAKLLHINWLLHDWAKYFRIQRPTSYNICMYIKAKTCATNY